MCMPFKMQELEQDMEQLININLGKVSNKTAYYQSYMKHMQTLLFKMPGWMNNKLESSFLA